MSKWFMEGIFVGSTALLAGGAISLMTANASGAILASGAAGGISTAITTKRKNHILKDELYQKLLRKVEGNIKNFLIEEEKIKSQEKQMQFDVFLEKQQSDYEKLTRDLEKTQASILDSFTDKDSLTPRIIKLESELQGIKKIKQAETEHKSDVKTKTKENAFETIEIVPENSLVNERQNCENLNEPEYWLNSQGIKLNNFKNPEKTELSDMLTELSLYLGDNFYSLKSFHNRLARSSETGSRFRFSLQSRTQEDIRIHTTFASLLKKLGYFSNYYYSKTEKVMNVTTHRNDEITSFLWGDWFERYIYEKIKNFCETQNISFNSIINSEVTFPNGDSYELDLFIISNGKPIWVECKAGKNFDAYLQQYSNQKKVLNVDKQNALVVSLLVEKNEAVMRSELWDVTVTNLEMLSDALKIALEIKIENDKLSELSTENFDQQKLDYTKNSLETTVLQKAKVRPASKHRKLILSELAVVYSDLSYSENLPTLKNHLIRQPSLVAHDVSANSIDKVLKTLLYSSVFLSAEKEPVKSVNTPICTLASLDEKDLEKYCIRNYVKQVLEIDSDYFKNEANVKQFEELVEGKFCKTMIS